MAVNNPTRKYHPRSLNPANGFDLFFKITPDQYRLCKPDDERYEPGSGNAPLKKPGEPIEGSPQFEFERDLQNYLAKNLGVIEPGLKLYDDGDEVTGFEFPAGDGRIDLLAVDKSNRYVVIELKVADATEKAIGQLMRYMTWIEQNMKTTQKARGVIVAREITTGLKLAASRVVDVRLVAYEISFKLHEIDAPTI
jgi:hypothetical protein